MKPTKKYCMIVYDYNVQCGCSNRYCKHRKKQLVINETQLEKLKAFNHKVKIK
jgi:hypothetical protein